MTVLEYLRANLQHEADCPCAPRAGFGNPSHGGGRVELDLSAPEHRCRCLRRKVLEAYDGLLQYIATMESEIPEE